MHLSSLDDLKAVIAAPNEHRSIEVPNTEWAPTALDYLIRLNKRYDFEIVSKYPLAQIREQRRTAKCRARASVERFLTETSLSNVNDVLLKGSLSYKNNYQPGWSDVDLVFVVTPDKKFLNLVDNDKYQAKFADCDRLNSVNFIDTDQLMLSAEDGVRCRTTPDFHQIARYGIALHGQNPFESISPPPHSFSEYYQEMLRRLQGLHKKSQLLLLDTTSRKTVFDLMKQTFILTKRAVNLRAPELVLPYYEDLYQAYESESLPEKETLLDIIYMKETVNEWCHNSDQMSEISRTIIEFTETLYDHTRDELRDLRQAYKVPTSYEFPDMEPRREWMQY